MKVRKKTLAIALFSVAFIFVVAISSLVLFRTIPQNNKPTPPPVPPVVETEADGLLYPTLGNNGLWGYMNSKGEIQITPAYDQADTFIQQVAWVKVDGLWGAINAQGETIVANQYQSRRYVDNAGSALVVTTAEADGIINSSLYDGKGSKIFGVDGEIANLSNNLLAFSRSKDGNLLWGFIDYQGRIVAEPVYKQVGMSDQNHAIVQDFDDKKYVINLTDKTTVEVPKEVELNALGSDRILSKNQQNLYGYLDLTGKEVIPYSFHYGEAFRNGSALVKTKSGYSIIDTQGKYLLESNYQFAQYLGNGFYALKKTQEDLWEITDNTGRLLISGVYTIGNWQYGILNLQMAENCRYLKAGTGLLEQPIAPLHYNMYYLGNLLALIDGNGISYYQANGELVYAMGRDLYLPDQQVIKPRLESHGPYYQVYYPKILSLKGEEFVSPSNQEINRRLQENAMGDYFADSRNSDNTVSYSIKGSYKYNISGKVVTVVQKTLIEDLWLEANTEAKMELAYTTLSFMPSTGQQFTLGNLFKKSVNWRTDLPVIAKEYYLKSCEEQGMEASAEISSFLDERLSRSQPYSIDQSGLTLFIPLANGNYEDLNLPFEILADLIDKNGGFWQGLEIKTKAEASAEDQSAEKSTQEKQEVTT